MPFWYFVRVPQLPPDVSHQSNDVDVRNYLLKEGDSVSRGTPIMTVENYWALMQLKANGNGIVKKLLFDPGTTVRIGDPVAIIDADGEDLPYGRADAILEIMKNKRSKRDVDGKP